MDSAIHFVISMQQLKGNIGQKKKREGKGQSHRIIHSFNVGNILPAATLPLIGRKTANIAKPLK